MITYSSLLKELIVPIYQINDPITFPKVIEEFSLKAEEVIRKAIKDYLEEIDLKFRYSDSRTKNYYVKDTKERTIITMFGEITYKRTIYLDRLTNKRFCYVDDKLGITKKIRYTNDVAAYITEAYSNENSMIKVGEEVGNLIYSKFSLKDNRLFSLPRQTIYNILKRSKEIRIIPLEEKRDIKDLYILMDEKFLPDHKEKEKIKNSYQVKSALILEGLDKNDKKRHKYINPQYYSAYKGDFSLDLINHISYRYNLDFLENIHILSDGANWIKGVSKEISFPNTKTTNYLDKFHFHQSIWRISKDKNIYKKAVNYLYHNNKEHLYKLFSIIQTDSNLKEISYIKNNYKLIQNTIHLKKMNCAMEQCVSHHLHSHFNNVPKVYSKMNINRYLSLRDNYRNNENIKLLFLESLKDKTKNDKTIINKKPLNLSIFDSKSDNHYYSIRLNNGKNIATFNKPSNNRFIFI